jgi:DNA-binding response OmpR family regulator
MPSLQETALEILLVEDNRHDAELVLYSLQKSLLANRVVWIADGREALHHMFDAARRDPPARPHLVLLDLDLPGLHGLDMARALRNNEQTRSIPIVVLTSSTDDRHRVESTDVAVDAYLVKPFDFVALARTIASLGYQWMAVRRVA